MSDTKKELDQEKGDEVLMRMLKNPPKVNQPLTKAGTIKKPSEVPAKKQRSEDQ